MSECRAVHEINVSVKCVNLYSTTSVDLMCAQLARNVFSRRLKQLRRSSNYGQGLEDCFRRMGRSPRAAVHVESVTWYVH